MARKQQHAEAQNESKKTQDQPLVWGLYILIILSIAAYVIFSNPAFGAIAFVLIIITLVAEFRTSIKEEGARKSLYEVLAALVAVVVIWLVLGIVLQTTSPLNVVASCSMLPTMHRGDLVILHGIPNMTSFIASHDIPVVNVSEANFSSMLGNMNSEFLAYYFHSPSNSSNIAEISNLSTLPVNLYNTICLTKYGYGGQYKLYSRCEVSNQSQNSNLVAYNYSLLKISVNGTRDNVASVSDISISGRKITENYSNPIIVYQTTPNDSFSGAIIHRLYAAIKVDNYYYLLTKGDNNPGLDMEFGNYPIASNNVVGYVVADIPYLGYLKLILSGQLAEPAGCNYTIIH